MMSELEPPLWSVKYRPESWPDFVGQQDAVRLLQDLSTSSNIPHLILLGASGTGKTAAATLFAREFLGDAIVSNYLYLNIRDIIEYPISKAKRTIQELARLEPDERTPFDEYMSIVYRETKETLRVRGETDEPNRSQMLQEAIRLFASATTLGDRAIKILVLDEADALTNDMQQALRRTMEIYSNVCRFILITDSVTGWSPAVLSRCVIVRFVRPGLEAVKSLIAKIASQEGVKVSDEVMTTIAEEAEGDMRRAIDLLQVCWTVGGPRTTVDTVIDCAETTLRKSVRKIVTTAINGRFVDARDMMKRLIAIEGYSARDILREMGNDLSRRRLEPDVLSRLMDRLAEIDGRIGQAKNPFIHVDAMLASIRRVMSEQKNSAEQK